MVLLSSRKVVVSEVNKRGGEERPREVVVLDKTHTWAAQRPKCVDR